MNPFPVNRRATHPAVAVLSLSGYGELVRAALAARC